MSSKSSNNVPSLKRRVQVVQSAPVASSPTPAKQIKREPSNITVASTTVPPSNKPKCANRHDVSEDDIIRTRLLYEGDQGIDDRRILTLTKVFNKSLSDGSSSDDNHNATTEKLLSSLYSIEHSYRLLQSSLHMDECEQMCYARKSARLYDQIKQLRDELDRNEFHLLEVKQRRLHLLEYDARAATINKLGSRRELRAQQTATLERKHYFEHLQQTFDTTYQQRLKQIAVYMRPIFELEELLRQDAHEDGPAEGPTESPVEQQPPPPSSSTPILPTRIERQRTNSDSSTASMDADDVVLNTRSKKQHNKNQSGMGLSLTTMTSANNLPQPLFASDAELWGTQLVDPLVSSHS